MEPKKPIHFQPKYLICEKCNVKKSIENFKKLKKFYKKNICTSCFPQLDITPHKKNINYKLKKALAAYVRNTLPANTERASGQGTTMTYIGCNIQYLREWLEYNFTKDMNWKNFGSYWIFGHITSLCKFDLTIEDDKLKFWNWSNLIPICKLSPKVEEIEFYINKLEKFKQEGSTTKWFSGNSLNFHKI